MASLDIHLATPLPEPGPACKSCGAPTRLVGIEPHLTKARTDLRIYECIACEATQAVVVPLGG
jgi:hypothetical protein